MLFRRKLDTHQLGFAMWEAMIWPVIIDGIMIVASVSLVEVVRKVRQLTVQEVEALTDRRDCLGVFDR